jgi:hypothetical protein
MKTICNHGDYVSFEMIDEVINRIAISYACRIFNNHPNCDTNSAASAGRDIFFGNFDDPEIKLVAFFHELGHSLMSERLRRNSSMSKISMEGTAWELGLGIAQDQGYKWDYYSKELIWARKQLLTYVISSEAIDELKK